MTDHNGGNRDRDRRGRFTKGNRAACGPHDTATVRLRAAIADEVGPDDLRRIFRALIDRAANGDTKAARLVLGYTVGRALDMQTLGRFERAEQFADDFPLSLADLP